MTLSNRRRLKIETALNLVDEIREELTPRQKRALSIGVRAVVHPKSKALIETCRELKEKELFAKSSKGLEWTATEIGILVGRRL